MTESKKVVSEANVAYLSNEQTTESSFNRRFFNSLCLRNL